LFNIELNSYYVEKVMNRKRGWKFIEYMVSRKEKVKIQRLNER